jgi:hypothetical protein
MNNKNTDFQKLKYLHLKGTRKPLKPKGVPPKGIAVLIACIIIVIVVLGLWFFL